MRSYSTNTCLFCRGERLLDILDKIQKLPENKNKKDTERKEEEANPVYPIPIEAENRKALLEWAYFEATSLIRQYGDLLEDVRSYMNTGVSTVGECVIMIEQELNK